MSSKRYKCPYCQYSGQRDDLIEHVADAHEEMIPEGYSPRRIVYNKINKRETGVCMVCKRSTEWNEKAGKYNKLCGRASCRKAVRAQYEERMLRVRGTTCLLDDDDFQEKMLANRKISGKYKFATGEEFVYTGQYEKKLLEFEEKVLNIDGADIIMPGPVLEYDFQGKTRKWRIDQLLLPWNLLIEVKDGGANPNTRPMESYRAKQVAKETMVTELGTYNYIRLTDNQFDQLLGILAELKSEMLDDSDENKKAVIRIHESAANAAANAIPSPNNGYYVLSYGYPNSTRSDDIEGFAVSQDVISDKLFIVKDGKITKESSDFLNNRKFSIYKYTGTTTLKDLLTEGDVADNYFYQTLSESGIVTKDVLDFSSSFQPVLLEAIPEIRGAIRATIFHQYNEAAGNDEMYFPIKHANIEGAKKNVIGDNENIDVLKDLNGYFVFNKDLNQRSKSYPSIMEIPKAVANIMANDDIMKEI